MKKSKVSVIIPVYNEEKDIVECLRSLEKQTLDDFEVIVVDDGSTDSSKFKVNTLLRSQSAKLKVILLTQNHKGAGAARNLGAGKAKGEILVFVDADMTFDPDFLKKLIKPIEEGRAIGTFSKEEYLANNKNAWALSWSINRGFPRNKMHPENYSDRQKVFRAILKSEFKKAGGFNEKAGYTDDWTLSEKLGVEAINAKGAIFYHNNPATLKEVYLQSKWMSKRKYKLGIPGILIALARVSFPVSFFKGIYTSFKEKLPEFFVFKIVSDWGQFVGIAEYAILGKVFK